MLASIAEDIAGAIGYVFSSPLVTTALTPAGTYIQTGPDGTQTVYRQPTGNQQNVFSASQTQSQTQIGGTINPSNAAVGFSLTPLLLLGGGLLLVMSMQKKGR
jgi:hypothetical protein